MMVRVMPHSVDFQMVRRTSTAHQTMDTNTPVSEVMAYGGNTTLWYDYSTNLVKCVISHSAPIAIKPDHFSDQNKHLFGRKTTISLTKKGGVRAPKSLNIPNSLPTIFAF